MFTTSALAATPFSQTPFTSLHYIEESLSRAAASDPQPMPTTRGQVEARNGSPSRRRRSPPLYGYSGTAPASGMYVRALYDYEADDRTSLSFHHGDVIQVLTQLESGWWDGVLHGVRGWFPSNYCALIPGPDDHGAAGAHAPGNPAAGDGQDEVDDDEDEPDEDDEDEDDDRYDDDDLDSEGNLIDKSPQLLIEGTDARQLEASNYWIPQATPDGQLFYFNTQTYDSTMELPLETPMSLGQIGPFEREGVRRSMATSNLAPQQLVQGTAQTEDDASLDDGNSVSEIELDARAAPTSRVATVSSASVLDGPTWARYEGEKADGLFFLRQRRRQDSAVSSGLSPAISIDSIGGLSPAGGLRNGDPAFHYPGLSSMAVANGTATMSGAAGVSALAGSGLAQPAGHAMPDHVFDQGSGVPITWNRLVENMRTAIERYRQAINNSDRSEYVKRADDISDHLRLLLAAGSGTTDNHSGQPSIILTNRQLYPHFRDMMSKFSKLVLSSHIAATDWPTPESYAKCLHEADGVLQGTYAYVEVARQQRGEDLPRLVPGFVNGSRAGGGWQNNGLAESFPAPATYLERDEYDMGLEPPTRLDGAVIGQLDESRRAIVGTIRRLEERLATKDKIVTGPAHEVLADGVCAAAVKVIEAVKGWLSTLESISLAALNSSARTTPLADFFVHKQRLYDLVAELLLACQAVAGPLGDEWAELRAEPLEERLHRVAKTGRELESCLSHVCTGLRELEQQQKPSGRAGKLEKLLGPEVLTSAGEITSPQMPSERDWEQQQQQQREPEEPPAFLNLDLEHELIYDRRVEPAQVRGGTLAALVEQLTRHDKLDSDFNNTFLLTYRSFTTATELFELLASRFNLQPPYGLTEQEHQSWVRIKQMPIRMRVVNILKSWFGNYWMEGYDTPSRELIRRAFEFASKSIASSNTPGAQPVMAVLDQRMRGQEPHARELIRNTNMPMPAPIVPKSLKKIKFLDIDATEFARQLTIMEANLYGKVKAAECLYKMWPVKVGADDPDPTPNIKALILHSNCLTNWVAEMILTQSEVKKRTLVIKRFITIADVSFLKRDISISPQNIICYWMGIGGEGVTKICSNSKRNAGP